VSATGDDEHEYSTKERRMSFTVKWTIVLTLLGLATMLAVYGATGSFGWAAIGLLAVGTAANTVAHPRQPR
jgi:hypothetical protein